MAAQCLGGRKPSRDRKMRRMWKHGGETFADINRKQVLKLDRRWRDQKRERRNLKAGNIGLKAWPLREVRDTEHSDNSHTHKKKMKWAAGWNRWVMPTKEKQSGWRGPKLLGGKEASFVYTRGGHPTSEHTMRVKGGHSMGKTSSA